MVKSPPRWDIQNKIWQLKTLHHKSYKEIIGAIYEEFNVEITDNQVREAIRRIKYKDPKHKTAIQAIHINTGRIREEVLNDLDEVITAVKGNPKQALTLINALKTKLSLASDIDRFEGRGVAPRMQINILQIKARDEKYDALVDWLLQKLPKDMLNEFQGFVEKTDLVVDAKYKVLNE